PVGAAGPDTRRRRGRSVAVAYGRRTRSPRTRMARVRETWMSQALSILQSLTLAQPLVLLVVVLGTPLVVLAARSRLGHTPARLRTGVIGLRLAVACLVVVALAQPTLRPVGRGRAVVFAVDVSDSVTADQLTWARAWVDRAITGLPPGSHTSVVEFGTRAQLAGAGQTVPTVSTDLSEALTL